MSIVKNLICLENDKASVIRFISDKMEFVRKDGEIDFPITVDFWEWWKKVVSYIDGDAVDICFVYDKNYDLLQETAILTHNIVNTKNSVWKIEHIKSYFWELKPTYLNLTIIGPNTQEYPLNGGNGAGNRRFQTNLNFISSVIVNSSGTREGKKDKPSAIQENAYSEFAKFFVDLIRRERG